MTYICGWIHRGRHIIRAFSSQLWLQMKLSQRLSIHVDVTVTMFYFFSFTNYSAKDGATYFWSLNPLVKSRN